MMRSAIEQIIMDPDDVYFLQNFTWALFLQVDVLMMRSAIEQIIMNTDDVYFLHNHTWAAIYFMNHEGLCQIIGTILNPIQDEGGGQKAPPPSSSFSSVTFANVGVSPKNFLTFSFDP